MSERLEFVLPPEEVNRILETEHLEEAIRAFHFSRMRFYDAPSFPIARSGGYVAWAKNLIPDQPPLFEMSSSEGVLRFRAGLQGPLAETATPLEARNWPQEAHGVMERHGWLATLLPQTDAYVTRLYGSTRRGRTQISVSVSTMEAAEPGSGLLEATPTMVGLSLRRVSGDLDPWDRLADRMRAYESVQERVFRPYVEAMRSLRGRCAA